MNVKLETWTLNEVINAESIIDPKPQYQRGNVWRPKDNKLLIDSILKGFDIPKIYLRKSSPESLFEFEVADGQQRLYAIWEFSKNLLTVDEIEINGNTYENIDYQTLEADEKLFDKFINFNLTISILENSTDVEVRTLFARLQMGKRLNEPEKRNAVGSAIGYAIDLETQTCPFFTSSKIVDSRFTKQDYLAHAITLIHFNNSVDLKAEAIKKMYEQLYVRYPLKYLQNAHKILDWIFKLNKELNGRIKNKWAFIDFFWMFYRHLSEIDKIDYLKMSESFETFENKRLLYSKTPEELIETKDKSIYDKEIYEYILAFNLSGNSTSNINTRAKVFDKKFLKFIKLKP